MNADERWRALSVCAAPPFSPDYDASRIALGLGRVSLSIQLAARGQLILRSILRKGS